MLSDLDRLYTQLLTIGFVVLRQAGEAGDPDWLDAELELLHNVPSLIGETNWRHHEYFWAQERGHYMEWVGASGHETPRDRMQTFYAPIWRDMEPLVMAMCRAGHASG